MAKGLYAVTGNHEKRGSRAAVFFSSSESRTTIQVNRELDFKSTANLTSSQTRTSLQVKLGLHFNRHSDFTSSERERSLWGYFWGAWRGTCLEVVIGGSVHEEAVGTDPLGGSRGDRPSRTAVNRLYNNVARAWVSRGDRPFRASRGDRPFRAPLSLHGALSYLRLSPQAEVWKMAALRNAGRFRASAGAGIMVL